LNSASAARKWACARRWEPSATRTTTRWPRAFASLECELIDRRTFQTKTEARLAFFTYIEGWYNPRRRHRALGYRSPANFERSHHDGSRTSPSSVQHDLTAVGVCVACATPPVDKSAPQLIEPAS